MILTKLTIYLGAELALTVSEAARARQQSKSSFVTGMVARALADEGVSLPAVARNAAFAAVGVDALLTRHADPLLRDEVVAVYRRRLAREGLSDEA